MDKTCSHCAHWKLYNERGSGMCEMVLSQTEKMMVPRPLNHPKNILRWPDRTDQTDKCFLWKSE